jgi:hypothetical protein
LSRVRAVLYGGAALAIATLSSPDTIRSALATSASALVEATPFLFAGIALSSLLKGGSRVVAYVGCGCTRGPGARSLPAAAATWLIFGPLVAAARYTAALLVARVLDARTGRRHHKDDEPPHVLAELHGVLPAALMAGAFVQRFAGFDPARLTPIEQGAAGALLGFTAAPCGLGAVALAGALRTHAPAAAVAFLCIAGIFDLRALGLNRSGVAPKHDACAYLLLAAASGVVAWRKGDALVHPALAFALWGCGAAAFLCATRYRFHRCATSRIAPGLMLAGALIGAPPPAYHATETTLTDLFAGERLTFAGRLSCDRGVCALVRYAITCCRADAAPMAVRLDRRPHYPAQTWLRADGRIDGAPDDLRLVAQKLEPISPPADPFIYR